MPLTGEITLPLARGVYEWLAQENDDDDVVTLKNFLRPLGFGPSSPATCFADQEFLDNVRRYQKDRGLKVDGVVAPGGETSRSIAHDFNEKINLLSEESDDDEFKDNSELAAKEKAIWDKVLEWQDVPDEWGESELDKRCAFNLNKVDIPSCDGVANAMRKRLIRQGTRPGRAKNLAIQSRTACRQQAVERYAACLKDDPAKDPDEDRTPLFWPSD